MTEPHTQPCPSQSPPHSPSSIQVKLLLGCSAEVSHLAIPARIIMTGKQPRHAYPKCPADIAPGRSRACSASASNKSLQLKHSRESFRHLLPDVICLEDGCRGAFGFVLTRSLLGCSFGCGHGGCVTERALSRPR